MIHYINCVATQALKNLKVNTQDWDVILTHIVSERLPPETKKLWEQEIGVDTEFPTYERLKTFLETQFRALESLSSKTSVKLTSRKNCFYTSKLYNCIKCSGPHVLRQCPQFLGLDFNGRRSVVREKQLCSNCLARGHIAASCPSRLSCFKCKHRHHTLLHDDSTIAMKTKSQQESHTAETSVQQPISEPSTSNFHVERNSVTKEVLLATALIRVGTNDGHETIVKALIDQGSQSTFISEATVQTLKLKGVSIQTTVIGIGDINAGTIKRRVAVNVGSLDGGNTFLVNAFVLKKLTNLLPSNKIRISNTWKHLEGLKLADPTYTDPSRIDMILGADIFCKILLNGVKSGPIGSPLAQKTIFGWILSGEVHVPRSDVKVTSSFHSGIAIDNLIRSFWEIEEVGQEKHLTEEEKLCEEIYVKTVQRLSDGRYIVRLPFKSMTSKPKFGRSRNAAFVRFKQLENKFVQSKELLQEYSRCMQEYLDLGHMVSASTPEIENMHYDKEGGVYYKTNYLPHHAVFKESTTTKLRIVFDASHKTFGGTSLNESLMTGPKIQDDLLWILLRWRKHEVAITADIEKMYRQVRVHDEDADYQRILWRHSPNEEVKDYKLQTLTFGTTPAPYLAIRTLHQLADDEFVCYPLASRVVKSDFYVDDLLTGSNSIIDCLKLQNQLTNLLKSGGFNLRKWASNKPELLKNIPKEDREISGVREFNVVESVKTLGINWHPKTDNFKYKLSLDIDCNKKLTKRRFLSNISKLFDPIGFLAPLIIKLKILMQALWIKGIDWDEEIPQDISFVWERILDEIKLIEEIEVPRWINTTSNNVEVHGFCDGSLNAYAAVLYVRFTDKDGKSKVTLLTSKTKVTPTKPLSLPRIELSGALLLARLFKIVKAAMKFDHIKLYAWTDSTIVISWLKGHASKYKTFVANRVAEIQEICGSHVWRYVPSECNPADCASRGLLPNELLNAHLWWNGPAWLQKPEEFWPQHPTVSEPELEVKKAYVHMQRNEESPLLNNLLYKYSSITKLVRVTAYCFRFVKNCQKGKENPTWLTATELEKALHFWIKKVQTEEFGDDIKNLEKGEVVKGKLKDLHPFLDHQQILRVGGRLQQAEIPWNEKHPIVLPHNHTLTRLIINEMHKRSLHGGLQLTISLLRRKYWIINARKAVKQQLHKCITCYRQKMKSATQLMGNLPHPRVQVSRVFQHVGVDYCGPLEIKSSSIRNAKFLKAYLAIFVCLSTKAIHIEVVSDLTTQAFLAAFKRFVSRRGLCSDIYSDNATNFVGARNIMKNDFEQHLTRVRKEIPETISNEGIRWHFIPPASPHFGGLWEAGVKSTKYHLKRTLDGSKLTFEELSTVTTQIEACLNSRPICPLTNDMEDMTALTPGHFLVGGPLLAAPEKTYLDINEHRLSRWPYTQRLVQSFWKRWQNEYLHTLQQRPKWKVSTVNIKIGELVVLKEDNTPPCKWPLARVVQVHPGSDGVVRVITVKTKNGLFKRAIAKVCLLPVDVHNDKLKDNE